MGKGYILLIILVVLVFTASYLYYQSQGLMRTYRREVEKGLAFVKTKDNPVLGEKDIMHLPAPVQKYLRYVGAVGREKVHNVRVVFEGEMKMDPEKDWVSVRGQQYNFFGGNLTRMFYMKAKVSGIPCSGLHYYNNEKAGMHIKALGLITVLHEKGPEMRIGDTTTLFNDMCVFAPATLIDTRIQWEPVDELTAKAVFNNNGCRISATLYFNEKGELVDFISEDRFYVPFGGSARKAVWSTPIGKYTEAGGVRRPAYGEAVWKLPEGDYCYLRFTNIKEVEFNCRNVQVSK